jgi:hypothetical protein
MIVYILLGARCIFNKEYNDYKIKFLHYDDINTGDILLVSYSSLNSMLNHSVLGLKFIHTTICSREGSNLYVYELANYFDKKIGFLKLPFTEWIKYNKNSLIMVNKLKIEEDSPEERKNLSLKFNNFREKYIMGVEFDILDFFPRYLSPAKHYKELNFDRENYACYEVILSMLKESGIIENLMSTENYTTDDLIGMKSFVLNEKYNYDEYFLADIQSLRFMVD